MLVSLVLEELASEPPHSEQHPEEMAEVVGFDGPPSPYDQYISAYMSYTLLQGRNAYISDGNILPSHSTHLLHDLVNIWPLCWIFTKHRRYIKLEADQRMSIRDRHISSFNPSEKDG